MLAFSGSIHAIAIGGSRSELLFLRVHERVKTDLENIAGIVLDDEIAHELSFTMLHVFEIAERCLLPLLFYPSRCSFHVILSTGRRRSTGI